MKELPNKDRLQSIIAELEESIPKDEAKFQIFSERDGAEGYFSANQVGYLRFGIEMLKAAFAPFAESSNSNAKVQVNIDYLVDPDSAFLPIWLERKEDIQPILSLTKPFAKIVIWMIVASLIGGVLLAFIGLVWVIQWVF